MNAPVAMRLLYIAAPRGISIAPYSVGILRESSQGGLFRTPPPGAKLALSISIVKVRSGIASVLLTLALAACGKSGKGTDEAGTPPYQPLPQDTPGEIRGEVNLARLLSTSSRGAVAKMPWAGTWWPYSEDGTVQADRLYDTITGRGGAADWELSNHGSSLPGLQGWWGHCNGWAAAAVLFEEPRAPVTVQGVT